MNVTREDLDGRRVRLAIEVDEERVETARRKAARRLGKHIRVPGFRPGKAPYHLVVQHLGPNQILEEAIEILMPEVIDEAVREQEIEVYSFRDAEINLNSTAPLVIQVTVPLQPEVRLGDLSAIQVTPEEISVTDEDVEALIEAIRDSRAVWEPFEGPVGYGDQISVDLRGDLMDGTTVVDETASEMILEPPDDMEEAPAAPDESESEEGDAEADEETADPADAVPLAPTPDEHLVGMMVNQVKEFPLVYPAGYPDPQLDGRTVLYRATVVEAKRKSLPEVDDEFAQEVLSQYDVTSVEEMRQTLRDNLQTEREEQEYHRVVNEIIAALADEAELDYPDAIVRDEVRRRVGRMEQQIKGYGLSMEQYFEITSSSRESLEEAQWEEAETFVRQSLALSEYVRESQIEVSPQELTSEIMMLSDGYDEQSADELINRIESDPEILSDVTNGLLTRKAVRALYESVTGEEAQPLFPPELDEAVLRAAAQAIAEDDEEMAAAGEDADAAEEAADGDRDGAEEAPDESRLTTMAAPQSTGEGDEVPETTADEPAAEAG